MKVSVIVPVYNVYEYIEKCLDSLVNQTYKNIEIILINDGSTDNSLDIIKKYQKKHENIIVINQENHGQGYARNKGIEKSNGEFIMFVDSDDYVDTDIVKKLVGSIKDNDAVVCNIYKVINENLLEFHNYLEYGSDKINFMLSTSGPVGQ
jgi:glycosyltransferase involved in cell wall biosynthesis